MYTFVVLLTMVSVSPAFGLDFYQGTVPSELRKERGYSSKEAQVSYAREGNRFVLVVSVGEYDPDSPTFGYDFYFEFHGEIERDGERVKLYELPYGEVRYDGGDGKCRPASNDCTLWFKWNIGRRSSARGRIVTEFSDNAVQLTFGITGYWFPIGQEKLDLTGTLQRSSSASEVCKLPKPGTNIRVWVEQCASL